MSMKSTHCQQPQRGRQRQHAGMNTSRMKMFTKRAFKFHPNDQSRLTCSNSSRGHSKKGKEQLGIRGKLGTLFACCRGVCLSTSPGAPFCNLLAAHARRQTYLGAGAVGGAVAAK